MFHTVYEKVTSNTHTHIMICCTVSTISTSYVHTQVLGTPQVLNLLHILQSMVLIERDSSDAGMIWTLLEELAQRTVLMNEPQRIEEFRRKSLELIAEAVKSRRASTANGNIIMIVIIYY